MRKYVAFKQNITAVTLATKFICRYNVKNFHVHTRLYRSNIEVKYEYCKKIEK